MNATEVGGWRVGNTNFLAVFIDKISQKRAGKKPVSDIYFTFEINSYILFIHDEILISYMIKVIYEYTYRSKCCWSFPCNLILDKEMLEEKKTWG